jgi:hypothetical protein
MLPPKTKSYRSHLQNKRKNQESLEKIKLMNLKIRGANNRKNKWFINQNK